MSTTTKPTLAFTGLGAMGGGMATNLVKNGFHVTGYDVYQPLLDKFVSAGGHAASSPREAASQADILISMAANAAQNSTLLFEGPDSAVHGLGKGKMFILCSTTAPVFALEVRRRFDEEFDRTDVKFLDCPVSGGTFRAADGSLSIFLSGPDADIDAAKEVLECMSGNLYRMGSISNGQKTKAIHQLLAATNIISVSEAIAFAASAGLNTQEVADHINNSDAGNDWSVLSALGIILKDAGIVTDVARAAQYPSPLANTAHDSYLAGVRAGLLREDDAKLVELYLQPSQRDLVHRLAVPNTNSGNAVGAHGITKETVADLLCGIHLAAAVEGMGFAAALGQDRKLMYEIISKAAGWSEMFVKCIPEMLERDEWNLGASPHAEEVGRELAVAVEKCQKLQFPCPMAAAALQQFYFGGLAKEG